MKFYQEVYNEQDSHLLKADLDSLMQWSEENQLFLNVDKRLFIILLEGKTHNYTT